LETLLAGQQLLLAARRLPAHGLEAWEEVRRRGYEGLVAKDESSAYLGGRTRSWLKVKRRQPYRTPGRARRQGTAILVTNLVGAGQAPKVDQFTNCLRDATKTGGPNSVPPRSEGPLVVPYRFGPQP